MLSIMRKKAGSWMIKIILGAVIIVFVFWGIQGSRSQKADRVAFVDDEPITFQEYKAAYNNLLQEMRRRFGSGLDEKMIKSLQIEKRALDRLIDRRLLLNEAKALHFDVSDSQLSGAIRKMEAFQTAGLFDPQAYRKVLSRLRLTPEEFEARQREEMILQKMTAFILDNAKVSDMEIRNWYDWINARLNIDYVLFEPQTYKDVLVSEEELSRFFEKNKASYKTDPKVKAVYISFRSDQFIKDVVIGKNEIKDYYEENKQEFYTPETVEARHILIKVKENASSKEDEEARKRAREIMEKARKGEDFATLAKKYSQGPTKSRGGYLGVFARGNMIKPFEDKAFSMKAEEISDPVRTRFGWHVIKVEKINREQTRSYDEAEKTIQSNLMKVRSKSRAYDAAELFYDSIFQGDDLKEIAETRGLTIQSTGFFTGTDRIEGVGDSSGFSQAAFNLAETEFSEVLDLEDGYYVIQVTDKTAAEIPVLNEVKSRVLKDVKQEKQTKRAKQDADDCLAALKKGTLLSAAAESYGKSPLTTGFFKRNGVIPKIGYDRAVSEAAFELSVKNPLPSETIKGGKGYYVIRFKDRQDGETKDFENQKEQIKKSLLQQKQAKRFEDFLAGIKEKSDIVVEDNSLQ